AHASEGAAWNRVRRGCVTFVEVNASLHSRYRNFPGRSDHHLSGMTDRGGGRERRDVRVRNVNRRGEFIGETAKSRAEHEPDLRTERRLAQNELCSGLGVEKIV